MRKTLTIPANQTNGLECPGLTLETAFMDDGSPETLVMVFRVEPLPGTRPRNMNVVKFSKRQHAIPDVDGIQLGTLGFYRQYEGEGEGIRDEMEGRFQEDISATLSKRMKLHIPRGSFKAQATMGGEDKWLFCASLVPNSPSGLSVERLGKRLGYECGAEILDAGAFAQELGAAFAIHTSWGDVRLEGPNKVLQLLASATDIKRTVFVYHGPVCYPPDGSKVVNSFPELHRPAITPFQKRPDYEWQQEYRFVFNFLGEPRAKTLLLPATKELSALSRVVWEDSIRRKR